MVSDVLWNFQFPVLASAWCSRNSLLRGRRSQPSSMSFKGHMEAETFAYRKNRDLKKPEVPVMKSQSFRILENGCELSQSVPADSLVIPSFFDKHVSFVCIERVIVISRFCVGVVLTVQRQTALIR